MMKREQIGKWFLNLVLDEYVPSENGVLLPALEKNSWPPGRPKVQLLTAYR